MAVRPLEFPVIAVDKTAKAFNAIRNKLGGLRKAALGVGAAVAGVGAAFAVAVNKTLNFADEIAKTADKVGFTTSALQSFRVATDLAGISQEQLDTALGAMSKRIGELRAGTGALNTFLNKTDKAFADQLKSTTDNEEAFRLLIGRIQGMKNAQDKAALSAAAFSRSAGIALSKLTLAELDEGIAKARELGIVIDEKLIRGAEGIKDKFELLTRVISTRFFDFMLKMMDKLDFGQLATDLTTVAIKAAQFVVSLGKMLGIIGKNLPEQIEEARKKVRQLEFSYNDLSLAGSRSFDQLVKKYKKLDEAKVSLEKLELKQQQLNKTFDITTEKTKKATNAIKDHKENTGLTADFSMYLAHVIKQLGKEIKEEERVLKILEAPISKFIEKVREVRTPLEDYGRTAKNVFNSVQEAGVDAMVDLEDSILGVIRGTMSAKDAFRNMANSIIDDILRIQIKKSITGPLSGFLDKAINQLIGPGSFGSSGLQASDWLPGKANGGPVSAGRPYLVGERGPELMVPGRSGTVIPNNALGGGVVINQTLNIETGVSQTVRAEIAQLMPQIANNTKAAVLDARRRGGSFANGFA